MQFCTNCIEPGLLLRNLKLKLLENGNPVTNYIPIRVFVKIMAPLFGYPKYEVPYYTRDPKRDHHFDNHQYTHNMVTEFKCLNSNPVAAEGNP